MSVDFNRILRSAGVLAILLATLYVADWIVLRIRVTHGTAYGSVEIHQFLATSLKGSKTEYDMTGSFQQTCGHSLFPHDGNLPCWWLERHTAQWE
jgi:hypothetical protein